MSMKLVVKQVQTAITFVFVDSEDDKNVIQVVKTYSEDNDKLNYNALKYDHDTGKYEKMNDEDSVKIINEIFKTNLVANTPPPSTEESSLESSDAPVVGDGAPTI